MASSVSCRNRLACFKVFSMELRGNLNDMSFSDTNDMSFADADDIYSDDDGARGSRP